MISIEQIINIAAGSLYWKNKNGIYMGCNKFMLETADINSSQSIIGKSDFELWHNEAQDIRENDLYVIENNQSHFFDEEVSVGDEKKLFKSSKIPFINQENEVIGVLCNSIEVTHLTQPEIATTVIQNKIDILERFPNKKYHFSKRELECIKLLCQGNSAKEIACTLGLSKRTIDFYIRNIKVKLKVRKSTEIISIALTENLI